MVRRMNVRTLRLSASSFALVAALCALPARADELVTTAGSSYAGKIVAEDAASVTIETAALGRLRVARAEIAKVRRDEATPAPSADPTKK
jgi:hypothetical protein